MSPTGRALRVCIDARVAAGVSGGVQQTIMGLASALSSLEDGPERYLFLAREGEADWLEPRLGGPSTLLATLDGPARAVTPRDVVRALIQRFRLTPLADAVYRQVMPVRIPGTPPEVERSGADVVHFTVQNGFRTSLPSIYVPHDLQHLHLPHLFDRWERRRRAAYYRPLCEQARIVVALSRWGKRDLVSRFGLPDHKVRVVGWAPIVSTYPQPAPDEVARAISRLGLAPGFALFPAQTWKHKNHLTLLAALALLRDRRRLVIPTVFCGHENRHAAVIERAIARLGLGGEVKMVGFIGEADLQALYRACRLLVYPSRFEGFGMPLLEAFAAGIPVASSDATCLPEIADGAAVLFPPDDVSAMAEAIRSAWTDESLRATLVSRGLERVKAFTWDRTARTYRALYRLVADRPLGSGDQALLEATL